jgi:hypothetical protein
MIQKRLNGLCHIRRDVLRLRILCAMRFLCYSSTAVIRVMLSGVRAAQRPPIIADRLWIRFRHDLCDTDYLVPTLVGTLELTVYPILVSLGSWQAVSGWLRVKTAAGWRWQQNQDRQGYTNFLLGNALVMVGSFSLAPMVKIWHLG